MPSTDKVAAIVRETPVPGGVRRSQGLFDRGILAHASLDALRKVNPRAQARNPVMLVVLIGTIVTLIEASRHPGIFTWSVTTSRGSTPPIADFAARRAQGR